MAHGHATWPASSTEANWACSGRLALIDGLPETTSEAADWGTCCHTIGEQCLRDPIRQAVDYVGSTIKGKQFEFEVDEEMADTAQVYVDYVRALVVDGAALQVEQRFSLDALKPPFDAGGTADAVVYKPKLRNLEVVDLKGGRGVVVAATGNKQLRTYALGAALANPALQFDTVTVTIVQPRADHRDGRIRSETFHLADLLEWTADLLEAMRQSFRAFTERKQMPDGAWQTGYLHAGDHCKFCPAAGFCPALEQRATDAAGVWFDDLDRPRISNRPEDFTPEQLAQRLDMLDMIQEWANAVRAYAHRQAEGGVEIPGYQLVEKIGNRAWGVPEQDVVNVLEANGVERDKLYTRNIVSPAQAEKLLGAKKKAAVAPLTERPSRGTSLVATGKTTRPAAVAAVNKHFDVLD